MHLDLPLWLRGAFDAVRDGPAAAIVRRDFLTTFRKLGLLGGPEAVDRTAEELRPAGGRGGARIVEAGELGEAVLRPYRRGGLPGRFLRQRYFLGNRAFQELIVTERLRRTGVPVAEPLAAVQVARLPGYVALLATRRVAEARPLSALLRENPGVERAATLLRRAGRTVRLLHEAGGWHADLHAGNLLLRPGDDAPAVLLDLDRARAFPPPLPRPLARRNHRRLRRSLEKLGLSDALRAWPAFDEGCREPSASTAGAETPARVSE